MNGRLKGKVAWISGAASGIGEATARLFLEEGASVALVDRNEKRLEALRRELSRQRGAAKRVLAIATDVSNGAQVKASVDNTVKAFGALHIVVNNAGIVSLKRVHECPDEEWDRLMAVNLTSMFLAVKHAYPHLKKTKRGYVVNLGSISSFVGQSSTPAYTTSKHAVLGFTRSVALDYAADGIRCNCVCPGITDTPLLREHLNKTPDPEATLRNRLRRVAMGVPLSPRDIAKVVRYFSCEDSSGVTGTSLVIDCGYTAAAEWEHPGHTAFMEKA